MRRFDSSRGHLASLAGFGLRPRLAPLRPLLRAARATQHCSTRIRERSDAPGNRGVSIKVAEPRLRDPRRAQGYFRRRIRLSQRMKMMREGAFFPMWT